MRRNDRGAGLASPSDDGGFELFFEFDPSCARIAAISARSSLMVAVSASTVVSKAVFVAAIAFTNAMSSSRDKSSGTHLFCLHSRHFHRCHTDMRITNIRSIRQPVKEVPDQSRWRLLGRKTADQGSEQIPIRRSLRTGCDGPVQHDLTAVPAPGLAALKPLVIYFDLKKSEQLLM